MKNQSATLTATVHVRSHEVLDEKKSTQQICESCAHIYHWATKGIMHEIVREPTLKKRLEIVTPFTPFKTRFFFFESGREVKN